MSHLKELFYLVVLCVSVLPVLPQNCDQFTIQPEVGPNMPLVIREGGGAMLTCTHVSVTRPPFTLSWFRETTAIREGTADTLDECSCEVPRVEPGSGNNREVIFMNFAQEFAGEYSCRAPRNSTAGTFDICRFNVLAAEEPSIRNPVPEQNRTVQIDETLTIPVIVDGVPSPTITWRRDSTELVNGSGRVSISNTGTLTVTGVTQNDRGNYSLSLSNTGGNLTRYFSVFVPFVDPPRILDPEVNSDQIRVTCVAVGYPTPSVEWQDSSGRTINSNEYAATVLTPGTYENMQSITISVSRFDCRGAYSCSATNTIRDSRVTLRDNRNFCNEVPPPPPQPMNVMITQNGADSVRVSWTIDTSNTEATFMIDVCYTPSGGDKVCLGEGSTLPKTATSTTISGLVVGVDYEFSVFSITTVDRNESTRMSVVLSPCSGEVIVQVLGVSVNTAVTDGERTFNITWSEAQDSNSVVTGYRVMETKSRWESIVADRTITNLTTPANFCNGEDHSFVVMAFDNCGSHGPASTPVVGTCKCPGRLKITSVTPYGSAIGVTWALKASASSYSIQPPLSITVLDIQIDSNGQQKQFNYSTTTVNDGTECLGGLDSSTVYKVCLHPTYSDGLTEIMPVCEDVTTTVSNENDFNGDECIKPETMTKVGDTFRQAVLPDYAIAVIVIGALILLAVVFCGIGVCFACSNSKNKDIDDIGSDYSSSIAAGMGMQGHMSSNHNRNMSPTRSCLSYHSKGHSTNWQDHMGTLREMETEVGTNV